jgi:RNA polymerase sigma-70 factor (ECF subfamily)
MNFAQDYETIERQSLADLVRAAQGGDRAAFDELFQRYHRAVYGVIFRRLGNHAEAQELCQEVFIQAMRKIHQLHNPLCFGGWLRSVANRMAINRAVRGRPKAIGDSGRLDAECAEHDTPLGEVLARERRDRVRVGLKRLTAMDRDTLVAFYFEGQSLVEMSTQFNSPVGTIKRRLHVARKRLAKELEALAPA